MKFSVILIVCVILSSSVASALVGLGSGGGTTGPQSGSQQEQPPFAEVLSENGDIIVKGVVERKGKSRVADSERRMRNVEKNKLKELRGKHFREHKERIVKNDQDTDENSIGTVIVNTGETDMLLSESIDASSVTNTRSADDMSTFYTNRGKKHATVDIGLVENIQANRDQIVSAELQLGVVFENSRQVLDVYYYKDGIRQNAALQITPDDGVAVVDLTAVIKKEYVKSIEVGLYSPEGKSVVTLETAQLQVEFDNTNDVEDSIPQPDQRFSGVELDGTKDIFEDDGEPTDPVDPAPPKKPRTPFDLFNYGNTEVILEPTDDNPVDPIIVSSRAPGLDSGGGLIREKKPLAVLGTDDSSGIREVEEETASNTVKRTSGEEPIVIEEVSRIAALKGFMLSNGLMLFIVLIVLGIFGRSAYTVIRKTRA